MVPQAEVRHLKALAAEVAHWAVRARKSARLKLPLIESPGEMLGADIQRPTARVWQAVGNDARYGGTPGRSRWFPAVGCRAQLKSNS